MSSPRTLPFHWQRSTGGGVAGTALLATGLAVTSDTSWRTSRRGSQGAAPILPCPGHDPHVRARPNDAPSGIALLPDAVGTASGPHGNAKHRKTLPADDGSSDARTCRVTCANVA
jgi:hypothetical protein